MTGQWLDRRGRPLAEAEVMADLARRSVVLLGEIHDRADHHLWQADVLAALAARGPVALGLEMLPAEADPLLQDWTARRIGFDELMVATDWPRHWGYDPALYRPLFDLAQARGLPLHGLNLDRALVRGRKTQGWAPLAALGLPPPVPSSADYRRQLYDLTGGTRPDRVARGPQDPAFDAFVEAQEVWDRAFACRLARITGALPIGIIGMGHLRPGGGVGAQGQDLGLGDPAVVLPAESPPPEGAADFVCLLPSCRKL